MISDFSIVPVCEADKKWVARLMAESEPWTTLGITFDQCLKVCHQPLNQIYVAQMMQEFVGMIILQDQGLAGSPYVKSIAVKKEHRNKGIGKLLLEFAEDKYRPASRFIFLCVSSFNNRALKFYEERGYKKIGELQDYIAEGHSELIMQKCLQ
jgi:ribosomal protein S18 acetylase RimI-like enzyme